MLPLDEHLRTQLELLHMLYPDIKTVREKQEQLKQALPKEPHK